MLVTLQWVPGAVKYLLSLGAGVLAVAREHCSQWVLSVRCGESGIWGLHGVGPQGSSSSIPRERGAKRLVLITGSLLEEVVHYGAEDGVPGTSSGGHIGLTGSITAPLESGLRHFARPLSGWSSAGAPR